MTDDFACDGDIALTSTEGASSSDYYDSGNFGIISIGGGRWADVVVECSDYAPMREGIPDEDVEKMPKPDPEAEERARKLLMGFLGKRRFRKAERSGYIDVASKLRGGRIYRIPFLGGQIRVEEDGKTIEGLCFNIMGDALPKADRVLARVLFAEHDEEELLKIANHFGPDSENEGYGDCDG